MTSAATPLASPPEPGLVHDQSDVPPPHNSHQAPDKTPSHTLPDESAVVTRTHPDPQKPVPKDPQEHPTGAEHG